MCKQIDKIIGRGERKRGKGKGREGQYPLRRFLNRPMSESASDRYFTPPPQGMEREAIRSEGMGKGEEWRMEMNRGKMAPWVRSLDPPIVYVYKQCWVKPLSRGWLAAV